MDNGGPDSIVVASGSRGRSAGTGAGVVATRGRASGRLRGRGRVHGVRRGRGERTDAARSKVSRKGIKRENSLVV